MGLESPSQKGPDPCGTPPSERSSLPIPRCVPMMQSSELRSRMLLRYDDPVTRTELLRRWCSDAPSGSSTAVKNKEFELKAAAASAQAEQPALTAALEAQEARQLALAALLLVVGQQLVDELPDQLFGRSVQNRKHVDYQGVHVPANRTDLLQEETGGECRRGFHWSLWVKRGNGWHSASEMLQVWSVCRYPSTNITEQNAGETEKLSLAVTIYSDSAKLELWGLSWWWCLWSCRGGKGPSIKFTRTDKNNFYVIHNK